MNEDAEFFGALMFIIAVVVWLSMTSGCVTNVKVYPFVETSRPEEGHMMPEQGAIGIAVKGVF